MELGGAKFKGSSADRDVGTGGERVNAFEHKISQDKDAKIRLTNRTW